MQMRLFIAALSLVFLSSCAQLTRLDTGKTIGEGNTEIGGQISAYGVDERASPDLGALAVPFVVINLNRGVKENLDLMFSANSSGNVFFSPKYQIVGDQNSQFAVSLLPGVDIQYANPDSANDPNLFFRAHISSILSVHQNKWALFLEPKYIFQPWNKTHFVGSTIGIDYSMERTSFALGVSFFPVLQENVNTRSSIYNVGFGVRRKLKGK